MLGKKTVNKEIEQFKKEIENWKTKYLRALADYQNLEKRTKEQKQEDIKLAAKNVIGKLLPALDALEKAQQNIKDKGLEIILKQLTDILTSENVERLKVIGEKFDPNYMECVTVEEGDKDGIVLEELRSGYLIAGILLRAAKVKVGRKQVN